MLSIIANVAVQALLWSSAGSLISITLVYLCILRPPIEPRGIPAVPFWVPLLALFKDVDQEDLFKRYTRTSLLEHGAVKIFFAGQWNVLVARPAFLAQIFKEEDDFQKSGNHKKIPGSVLASYLGENIISAHGETWRTFRGIMQPGLQEGWKADAIFANAKVICQQLSAASIGDDAGAKMSVTISIREYIQRYTIANLAEVILGVDFGVSSIRGVNYGFCNSCSNADYGERHGIHHPDTVIYQTTNIPTHLHEFPVLGQTRSPEPREGAQRGPQLHRLLGGCGREGTRPQNS